MEILISKFVWVTENSRMIFLQSKHSRPLAGQERLSLARTRTGLPKRTNTTCDLLRVTQALALCPLSHRWSITDTVRGCPADRGGHLPSCQIFHVLWGNYAPLYMCWFSALAQEKPSEGKTRAGFPLEQQLLSVQYNSDLTLSWQSSCSPTPDECSNGWERQLVWQVLRGWSRLWSGAIDNNLIPETEGKLGPELRVRHAQDRQRKGHFQSGGGGQCVRKHRGRTHVACWHGSRMNIKYHLCHPHFTSPMLQKEYILSISQK